MIAISEKIDEIYSVSKNANQTFKDKINSFLDDVLIIKKDIIDLTQMMNDVIDSFFDNKFSSENYKEYIPKIQKSIKLATFYSNKLEQSNISQCIRVEHENLKWAIDNFNEILDDIKYYHSDSKKILDAYFEDQK